MLDLSTGGAAMRAPATLAVEIVCIKSSWCAAGAFESQLLAAVAGLTGVKIAWAPPARARAVLPSDLPADGTPVLLIKVGGRVMAHALGAPPRWELRSLIETAQRNAR